MAPRPTRAPVISTSTPRACWSPPNGLPVLGDGGPVTVPPNTTVQIGGDGTISAQGATGRPTTIGRLKLVTPEAKLQRGEDGLFRAADGADLPADPNARLESGVLEGSNVSAVETMVGMIAAARQFEQQMKLLSLSQTQGQVGAKLLSPT
jgi:flagellar basal-body rod protein FlgF